MYKEYFNAAIDLERKGHSLFEKLQLKANNIDIKNFFKALAKDELMHIKEINKLLAVHPKTLDADGDPEKLIELNDIINGIDSSQEIKTLKNGVELAIEIESAIIEVYKIALEYTKNFNSKKFFEKMIDYESVHYSKLNTLLETL